jgi:hypothetical protein
MQPIAARNWPSGANNKVPVGTLRSWSGNLARVASRCSLAAGSCSHAWLARFRRLARDYERLPETLRGLHFLAFALPLLARFVALVAKSA